MFIHGTYVVNIDFILCKSRIEEYICLKAINGLMSGHNIYKA